MSSDLCIRLTLPNLSITTLPTSLPIFSEPVKLTIQVNIVANVGLTQVDISAADDLFADVCSAAYQRSGSPGQAVALKHWRYELGHCNGAPNRSDEIQRDYLQWRGRCGLPDRRVTTGQLIMVNPDPPCCKRYRQIPAVHGDLLYQLYTHAVAYRKVEGG